MIAVLMVGREGEEACIDTAKSERHDQNPTAGSVPKPLETEDLFS